MTLWPPNRAAPRSLPSSPRPQPARSAPAQQQGGRAAMPVLLRLTPALGTPDCPAPLPGSARPLAPAPVAALRARPVSPHNRCRNVPGPERGGSPASRAETQRQPGAPGQAPRLPTAALSPGRPGSEGESPVAAPQVFLEELNRKQPDVEKATKSCKRKLGPELGPPAARRLSARKDPAS